MQYISINMCHLQGVGLGGRDCMLPVPAFLYLVLVCLQSILPVCKGFLSCSSLMPPWSSPPPSQSQRKPHYQILLLRPWGIECTWYGGPPQEVGSHFNPWCSISGMSQILCIQLSANKKCYKIGFSKDQINWQSNSTSVFSPIWMQSGLLPYS